MDPHFSFGNPQIFSQMPASYNSKVGRGAYHLLFLQKAGKQDRIYSLVYNSPYIAFHIKDMYKAELYTELFYPTLFPCFVLICYPYILLHFNLVLCYIAVCCIECFHGDARINASKFCIG